MIIHQTFYRFLDNSPNLEMKICRSSPQRIFEKISHRTDKVDFGIAAFFVRHDLKLKEILQFFIYKILKIRMRFSVHNKAREICHISVRSRIMIHIFEQIIDVQLINLSKLLVQIRRQFFS